MGGVYMDRWIRWISRLFEIDRSGEVIEKEVRLVAHGAVSHRNNGRLLFLSLSGLRSRNGPL